MTYEDHFSTDWESLTRDEAMVRAFVLGIAAVEGDENPEELARLEREDNAAFVRMAYNAGRRERLDIDEEEAEDAETSREDLPTATAERLSEFLDTRPDGPERPNPADGDRPRSQVDVPAMLETYEFLDTRPDDGPDEQDRLDLPDFLK